MKLLSVTVVVVSIFTLATGLGQLILPEMMLENVGVTVVGSVPGYFSVIGMYMALFAALILHAVYDARPNPIPVLWGAIQKIGVAIAIFVGVVVGEFSLPAVGIAGFDSFCALVYILYWKKQKRAL